MPIDNADLPGGDNLDKESVRDKVKPLSELGELAAKAREDGKRVVLAHGVFDLIHMGHVRHLEEASRHGDVLIVTITADQFVNKGPDRPVFKESMRAEMLAAIEYVAYVGINFATTSISAINEIKPDIYIKGPDYKNPEEDLTGQIRNEQDAVEKNGGQLIFTSGITFSSSALINEFLSDHEAPLKEHLGVLKSSGRSQDIIEIIESVKDYRVLMVGDTIIDEYHYVSAMGKSAKENMISTRFMDTEVFAGGIIAAANHVADFCAEVEVVTCLGELESFESFIREHLKENVKLVVVERENVPTTRKTRYVDGGYLRKLFEVYTFDDSPAGPEFEARMNAEISKRAPECDLVIATDFGHGAIAKSTIDVLADTAKFLAVNTQTNSANIGYNLITRYSKADYVCIDAPEAQLAVADRFSSLEEIICEKLPQSIDCSKFIITHGKQGCVTFEKGGDVVRIPAFTKTVVDSVGAGDAFLSITSPLAAAGGALDLIGFVGNAAGAMKVGIIGHRHSIEKVPLIKYITTLLK